MCAELAFFLDKINPSDTWFDLKKQMMIKEFDDYLKNNNYETFDLKGVLFDMDGVLYDSMKAHVKSWHETMTELNIDCSADEFYLYEGATGHNTINRLIKRAWGRDATQEEKETIYTRKSKLFMQYNAGETIPFAYDMLKAVRAMGLQCVVVTGSGQKSLLDKLGQTFPAIFDKDKMVTALNVEHGKPHPEPYLKGLQKAGNLKPNQAIVIENAPLGVEAAVAANIFTIAINTGLIPDAVLAEAGANIVLPSMKALFDNWGKYAVSLGL